jgi:hypothetical protein
MPKRDATNCLSGSAGADKRTDLCASLRLEMRLTQRECSFWKKKGSAAPRSKLERPDAIRRFP